MAIALARSIPHAEDMPAMAKRFKAAVIGGSGYGGAELIRRLLRHPDVELVRVASVDFIGEPLGAAHPNLEGRTASSFEGITPGEAAKGMDIVLLGLPHKVSAQKMTELMATGARVVDLSGDFRLRDAAVVQALLRRRPPRPRAAHDGTFVYGLPGAESRGDQEGEATSRRPAASRPRSSSALLPLAKAGLLEGEVETVGITGSSGSGVAPSAGTHHPVRAVNLRTYKPLDHQHIPEIVQTLGVRRGARTSTSASSP